MGRYLLQEIHFRLLALNTQMSFQEQFCSWLETTCNVSLKKNTQGASPEGFVHLAQIRHSSSLTQDSPQSSFLNEKLLLDHAPGSLVSKTEPVCHPQGGEGPTDPSPTMTTLYGPLSPVQILLPFVPL